MKKCDTADGAANVRRLGVFGGTFDPVHIGHLIIAEEARVRMALDRVLFVPAKVSPLKLGHSFAPGWARLQMLEVAVEDNARFLVSDVDLRRDGPSFTVDTLRAIKNQYGSETQLFFIMGTDSLCGLKTWHRPQEILSLTRIIAVSRPGFDLDWQVLEDQVPGVSSATDLLETISLGISSTDIRARLQQGLPIRYQIPAAVESYIRQHHLYA